MTLYMQHYTIGDLLKNVSKFILGLLLTGNALAADMVLINGMFYTVDDAQPWVEAVAIKDSRFVYR